MKSLIAVMTCILHDMGDVCGVSTDRDLETVLCRVECEGLSFLTITLPTFAKSLEQALDKGSIASGSFPGFQRRAGLPVFLQGFLRLVFDSRGVLLDVPSVDAIRCVRQVCYLFSKLEKECTPRRTRAAFDQYIECEKQMRETILPDLSDLRKVFLVLFGNMLGVVSDKIKDNTLVPKHGPGSTSDRLSGNRKWKQKEWPRRADRSFPIDSYLVPSQRHWMELSRVQMLEPGAERPVKVIAVPKTLKTPRIIAVEPTCMQYMQQALLRALTESVHEDRLISVSLGLDDQLPNRELARLGSENQELATLDLSEASDRVSNQLVFGLTRPYRIFADALQDCRSKRADVPGHGRISLAKFASMGSAVCFPIEGMVFLAISTLGVALSSGHPLTAASIKRSVAKVRVFGDDIIVPSRCAQEVSDLLETYGLKVNRSKSFWTGKFRESCGGDYYDGTDISIHRFRREFPDTSEDAQGVASLFSFRNKCYVSGYWKTARLLDSHLASSRIPVPRVSSTSSVLGRLSFLGYETQRIDRHLHSPLVRGMKMVSRPPTSPLGGVGALMKFFALRRVDPLREGHLERLGRPDRVRTKIGWGSPF